MNKHKSESAMFPKEFDLTSSDTTVYVRENIVAEQRTQMNGEIMTMYVFDETQYTKAEYESIIVAQTRADVDYIAIMKGVEL